MRLVESTDIFVSEKFNYYENWILDEPLFISEQCLNDLGNLQKILYKLINEFVTNYSRYKHLMPVPPEVERIIDLFDRKPYHIGTYRTDFVFDMNRQIKLIEITCRMGMNGVFQNAVMEQFAVNYMKNENLQHGRLDLYQGMFKKLDSCLKDVDSVTVLQGSDRKNESNIFTDIFERMDVPVRHVHYTQIGRHLETISNSWIISELSFDEILTIDLKALEFLLPLNITNDFRTIFLIHDKRFFDVLGNTELREAVLTASEIQFFDNYYIPTFSNHQNPQAWQDAKHYKNNWILKHRALGKSQEIYAGVVTDSETWRALFESDRIQDMVLQEWVTQPTYKTTCKGEEVNDYLTGTLLYYDDEFFGLGEFRTSSFPVTNKVDHRKMAGICLSLNDDDRKKIEKKIFI